jgi:hypothetical protein
MKIVLVYPLAPSVEKSVTFLFSKDSQLTMQVNRLDDFSFQLIDYSEPCIILFSAIDLTSRNMIRRILEACPVAANPMMPGPKERSPFCRVLIVGEESGGMAVQNWRQFGVHEFILGPIVSRALQIKIDRHRKKILQELEEFQKQGLKLVERQIEASQTEQKNDVNARKPEFAVHGIVLGPNTFLFPKDEAENEPRKIVVACECPQLQDDSGQWVRRSELLPAKAGVQDLERSNEAIWDWVYSKGVDVEKQKKEEDRSFRYIGEKPMYDKTTGKWVFRGKAPLMFHNRLATSNAKPHSSSAPPLPALTQEDQEAVFGYYSECGLVMYKGDVQAESAKVWFVRIDDFSDSPLRFYQKNYIVEAKRARAAPGGINDSPDEDLLKALSAALKNEEDESES